MPSFDLFEIMRTTRSMRRLKPDPVPDALLNQVLEAGTFAANGGNMQSWRFLVIRDPAIKTAAAEYLADHFHEAPVWIVPCLSGPRGSGASIFPAVQNMLLAARALGLGTTLTTLYLMHEKETEAAMGLPEDVHSYAILPMGLPMGKFGPVRRAPLGDVVFDDQWGKAWVGP
jgi:nitroreductase